MTFDLTDWWPTVDYLKPICCVMAAFAFACLSHGLWEKRHDQNAESRSLWRVEFMFSLLLTIVVSLMSLNAAIFAIFPNSFSVSLSDYLNEQANIQTNGTLTGISCQTPKIGDIPNGSSRYPCNWVFNGSTIQGTVMLTEPQSSGNHLPSRATLLDAHGDSWCPAEWDTSDGCKPILKSN